MRLRCARSRAGRPCVAVDALAAKFVRGTQGWWVYLHPPSHPVCARLKKDLANPFGGLMWKTELLAELSRAKYIESGVSAAIFERGDDSDASFNGRVWRPGCYATRTLPLFSKREITFLVKFFLAWGDGGSCKGSNHSIRNGVTRQHVKVAINSEGSAAVFPTLKRSRTPTQVEVAKQHLLVVFWEKSQKLA